MITCVFCYDFKSFSGDESSPKPVCVCVCIYSKYILNNIYAGLQAFGVSHFYFMCLIEVSYAHQDCIRKYSLKCKIDFF